MQQQTKTITPVPTNLTMLDLQPMCGRSDFTPKEAAIPDDYFSSTNKAHQTCSSLFFSGGKISDFGYRPRPDVENSDKAWAAIRCALASMDIKHEVKIAGVAYLLDMWFTEEPEPQLELSNWKLRHGGIKRGLEWVDIGEHRGEKAARKYAKERYGKSSTFELREA